MDSALSKYIKPDYNAIFFRIVENGDIEALTELLDHHLSKIDLEFKNHEGTTPFVLACENNHTDIVEILLKAGCNKNHKDTCEDTPLIRACINGYTDLVKILLKAGCDKEVQNSCGQTALGYAIERDFKEIIDLLLT